MSSRLRILLLVGSLVVAVLHLPDCLAVLVPMDPGARSDGIAYDVVDPTGAVATLDVPSSPSIASLPTRSRR